MSGGESVALKTRDACACNATMLSRNTTAAIARTQLEVTLSSMRMRLCHLMNWSRMTDWNVTVCATLRGDLANESDEN
jgi:hypothetical protein